MIALALFLLGCYAAWSGFTTGGASGFGMLIGAVVMWLFAMASMGMAEGQRHVNRRPPTNPPGKRWTK